MKPHTVQLQRVMRCTPEKIYKAFLHAEAMARWLPPHGFLGTVHHLDARVGGTFRMSFASFHSGQGHSFGGTYLALSPFSTIRYTTTFDDPGLPGEMHVQIDIHDVTCGASLHIEQSNIPTVIPVEMCYLGWQESLAQLTNLVESHA